MGAAPSRESLERYKKILESSECLEFDMLRLLRSFPLQRDKAKEVHAKHSSRNKKKQLVLIPLTKSFVNSLGIAECTNKKETYFSKQNDNSFQLEPETTSSITHNHEWKGSTSELFTSQYTHLHATHHLQDTEEQEQQIELLQNRKEMFCNHCFCHQCDRISKDITTSLTHSSDSIHASEFPLIRQLYTVYNEPAVQFYNVAATMPEEIYKFDQLPEQPQYATLQEFYNTTVEEYDKRLYATDEELCAAWLSAWNECFHHTTTATKERNTIFSSCNAGKINTSNSCSRLDSQNECMCNECNNIKLSNTQQNVMKQNGSGEEISMHDAKAKLEEINTSCQRKYASFSEFCNNIPERLWPIPCAICFVYPTQQKRTAKTTNKQTSSQSNIRVSDRSESRSTKLAPESVIGTHFVTGSEAPILESTSTKTNKCKGNAAKVENMYHSKNKNDLHKCNRNTECHNKHDLMRMSANAETLSKNNITHSELHSKKSTEHSHLCELNKELQGQTADKTKSHVPVSSLEENEHLSSIVLSPHYRLMAVGFIGLISIKEQTQNTCSCEAHQQQCMSSTFSKESELTANAKCQTYHNNINDISWESEIKGKEQNKAFCQSSNNNNNVKSKVSLPNQKTNQSVENVPEIFVEGRDMLSSKHNVQANIDKHTELFRSHNNHSKGNTNMSEKECNVPEETSSCGDYNVSKDSQSTLHVPPNSTGAMHTCTKHHCNCHLMMFISKSAGEQYYGRAFYQAAAMYVREWERIYTNLESLIERLRSLQKNSKTLLTSPSLQPLQPSSLMLLHLWHSFCKMYTLPPLPPVRYAALFTDVPFLSFLREIRLRCAEHGWSHQLANCLRAIHFTNQKIIGILDSNDATEFCTLLSNSYASVDFHPLPTVPSYPFLGFFQLDSCNKHELIKCDLHIMEELMYNAIIALQRTLCEAIPVNTAKQNENSRAQVTTQSNANNNNVKEHERTYLSDCPQVNVINNKYLKMRYVCTDNDNSNTINEHESDLYSEQHIRYVDKFNDETSNYTAGVTDSGVVNWIDKKVKESKHAEAFYRATQPLPRCGSISLLEMLYYHDNVKPETEGCDSSSVNKNNNINESSDNNNTIIANRSVEYKTKTKNENNSMTVATSKNNNFINNSSTNIENALEMYTTQYVPLPITRAIPSNNVANDKDNITFNNTHITSLQQQQQQHQNKMQMQLPLELHKRELQLIPPNITTNTKSTSLTTVSEVSPFHIHTTTSMMPLPNQIPVSTLPQSSAVVVSDKKEVTSVTNPTSFTLPSLSELQYVSLWSYQSQQGIVYLMPYAMPTKERELESISVSNSIMPTVTNTPIVNNTFTNPSVLTNVKENYKYANCIMPSYEDNRPTFQTQQSTQQQLIQQECNKLNDNNIMCSTHTDNSKSTNNSDFTNEPFCVIPSSTSSVNNDMKRSNDENVMTSSSNLSKQNRISNDTNNINDCICTSCVKDQHETHAFVDIYVILGPHKNKRCILSESSFSSIQSSTNVTNSFPLTEGVVLTQSINMQTGEFLHNYWSVAYDKTDQEKLPVDLSAPCKLRLSACDVLLSWSKSMYVRARAASASDPHWKYAYYLREAEYEMESNRDCNCSIKKSSTVSCLRNNYNEVNATRYVKRCCRPHLSPQHCHILECVPSSKTRKVDTTEAKGKENHDYENNDDNVVLTNIDKDNTQNENIVDDVRKERQLTNLSNNNQIPSQVLIFSNNNSELKMNESVVKAKLENKENATQHYNNKSISRKSNVIREKNTTSTNKCNTVDNYLEIQKVHTLDDEDKERRFDHDEDNCKVEEPPAFMVWEFEHNGTLYHIGLTPNFVRQQRSQTINSKTKSNNNDNNFSNNKEYDNNHEESQCNDESTSRSSKSVLSRSSNKKFDLSGFAFGKELQYCKDNSHNVCAGNNCNENYNSNDVEATRESLQDNPCEKHYRRAFVNYGNVKNFNECNHYNNSINNNVLPQTANPYQSLPPTLSQTHRSEESKMHYTTESLQFITDQTKQNVIVLNSTLPANERATSTITVNPRANRMMPPSILPSSSRCEAEEHERESESESSSSVLTSSCVSSHSESESSSTSVSRSSRGWIEAEQARQRRRYARRQIIHVQTSELPHYTTCTAAEDKQIHEQSKNIIVVKNAQSDQRNNQNNDNKQHHVRCVQISQCTKQAVVLPNTGHNNVRSNNNNIYTTNVYNVNNDHGGRCMGDMQNKHDTKLTTPWELQQSVTPFVPHAPSSLRLPQIAFCRQVNSICKASDEPHEMNNNNNNNDNTFEYSAQKQTEQHQERPGTASLPLLQSQSHNAQIPNVFIYNKLKLTTSLSSTSSTSSFSSSSSSSCSSKDSRTRLSRSASSSDLQLLTKKQHATPLVIRRNNGFVMVRKF